MRKLKKAFSLTLALALSLSLAVPAMAAGELTIQDDGGFSYTLSKPLVGTRVDEQNKVTYYQIPEGTIITPVVPEGTVKEEVEEEGYYMGGRLVYKLPNGGGVAAYVVGTVFDSIYGGYDAQWFGDLEGMSTFDFLDEAKATPTQPLPATPPFEGDRGYCLSRGFREDYNTFGVFDRYTYLWFEIVPDNGSTTPSQPQQPAGTTASPTNDSLTADGALQTPTVYKINGSNYFKIRDLAAILNGTGKQFSVGYDGTKNAVTATTGQGYARQPGDLAGAATGGSQTAEPSNDAIYVDGQKITAEVYKINGSNYFKLRDLGKALDFYVGWSADRGVYIETDKPYSE